MAWVRQGKPTPVKGQTIAWAAYDISVQGFFDWSCSKFGHGYMTAGRGQWEGRISERVLLAPVLAVAYELPPPPQNLPCWEGDVATGHSVAGGGPKTWRDAAKKALDQILPQMEPDGLWPHPNLGDAALVMPDGRPVQVNYMVALLLDALTRYFDEFEPDPRILPIVQRSIDFLWNTQWKGSGFPYYSHGTVGPADLNLLYVSAWGFVFRETGDPKYRAQGDLIFAEGVKGAWINQVAALKQFNENYRSAHRYIERRGDPR
jgi:hypothetical protein